MFNEEVFSCVHRIYSSDSDHFTSSWPSFSGDRNCFNLLLLIRSDEGLTLETSAFDSLYGGQFTLSTQLIKPIYLTITKVVPSKHNEKGTR